MRIPTCSRGASRVALRYGVTAVRDLHDGTVLADTLRAVARRSPAPHFFPAIAMVDEPPTTYPDAFADPRPGFGRCRGGASGRTRQHVDQGLLQGSPGRARGGAGCGAGATIAGGRSSRAHRCGHRRASRRHLHRASQRHTGSSRRFDRALRGARHRTLRRMDCVRAKLEHARHGGTRHRGA